MQPLARPFVRGHGRGALFHISMPWIAKWQSYLFIRAQIEPYPKPQSLQDELRSVCRGRSRLSLFTIEPVDMSVILQMHVSTVAAVIGGIRAEGHLSPEDRGDSTRTEKSVPSPERFAVNGNMCSQVVESVVMDPVQNTAMSAVL